VQVYQSTLARAKSPSVPAADLKTLAADDLAFAVHLYQAIRKQSGNLFYSPYSIYLALAMTSAGAKGQTATQMAKALHFSLPQERLHPALDALDLQLASRGQGAKGQDGQGFRLRIANSIWGQASYQFLKPFLDTLATNYGAGLRTLDFAAAPEPARQTINGWVKDQTEGKIPDLLPQGVIDVMTRLVLVNAIYFNAAWKSPFTPTLTKPMPFHLADGKTVDVPTMSDTVSVLYAKGQGYQAVALPYDGDELDLVILLPDAGTFAEFEQGLASAQVEGVLAALSTKQVALSLPKLKYESKLELVETLKSLGMSDAFDPKKADFSGMTEQRELYISDVVHKAIIALDEKGTEAAAATGVVMRTASAPQIDATVAVDRPFVFLIRDVKTGAVVFVGRVLDPSV
jgi:serine protease inhibitor